jgi:hypothetical protein
MMMMMMMMTMPMMIMNISKRTISLIVNDHHYHGITVILFLFHQEGKAATVVSTLNYQEVRSINVQYLPFQDPLVTYQELEKVAECGLVVVAVEADLPNKSSSPPSHVKEAYHEVTIDTTVQIYGYIIVLRLPALQA